MSDKSGILYKAVLTRGVIVLIDRPVGPVVSDILNLPQRTATFHGRGVKRLAREKLSAFLSEPY